MACFQYHRIMKILFLYATLSGNSAMLSEQLSEKMTAAHPDHQFEVKDADNSKGENFADFDLVIFVTSTWDEGNMNLVCEEFLDQLSGVEGRRFALIGLGDTSYIHYCGAVEKVEAKLRELGATLIGTPHKVDGFIDDDRVSEAATWAEGILAS